jgi:hypothetical protein
VQEPPFSLRVWRMISFFAMSIIACGSSSPMLSAGGTGWGKREGLDARACFYLAKVRLKHAACNTYYTHTKGKQLKIDPVSMCQ